MEIVEKEQLTMMAKTLYGLEEVLCKELQALGAEEIEKGRRVVYFKGDKRSLYRANIHLRTALRVLVPIATFEATNADEVYDYLNEHVKWDNYLDQKSTFAVDSVVYSDHFTHSKFVAYRTKDAIADYFSDLEGRRPNVSVSNPDILFHLHISHTTVTLALDSSGESLHMRGYRKAQTDAPISEVLAAGMLLLAGWEGKSAFVDPMCGSGTILIEALLIAKGIPPGIFRPSFAFERWKDFDEELFRSVLEEWEERPFEHKVIGADISPKAIAAAKKNAEYAGVVKDITFIVSDVADLSSEQVPTALEGEEPPMLMTNPPYGERLRPEDLEQTYSILGSKLKHLFTGYRAWVISSSKEGLWKIGLKPFFKETLFNGSLECELRGYETFSGKRKEFLETAPGKTTRRSAKESEFKTRGYSVSTRKSANKDRRDRKQKPEFKEKREQDKRTFKPRTFGTKPEVENAPLSRSEREIEEFRREFRPRRIANFDDDRRRAPKRENEVRFRPRRKYTQEDKEE
ncbi:MAG: THUMP domain-containing protein [Porphyromonas sp.]|nr:THUMP domain-containing protein [Porphyromonas sp.]